MEFFKKHAQSILTGLIIGNMTAAVASTGLAVISVHKKYTASEFNANTFKKAFKETPLPMAKDYILPFVPTMLFMGAGVVSVVALNKHLTSKVIAAQALAAVASTNLSEYKAVADKVLDKKSGEALKEGVAQKALVAAGSEPPARGFEMEDTLQMLFFDRLSSRYFKSTMNEVERAVIKFKRDLLGGLGAHNVNEFYWYLGLEPTLLGDDAGWNYEDEFDVVYQATLLDDGRPCIVLDYKKLPKPLDQY